MKRFFNVLLGMMALSNGIFAQITITASEVDPIGYSAVQSRDTMPEASIQFGGSGELSWDFTDLKDQARDTLVFTEPGDTPHGAQFPAANIGVRFGSDIYIYFDKTDDRLALHGSFGRLSYSTLTLTTGITFTPPQTVIQFPMNLNDNFSQTLRSIVQVDGDSVGFSTFDSVRLVTFIQREVDVAAYGQLTTPTGTFETLRSTETEISTDSVYVLSGTTWFPFQGSEADTVVYYNWWTNQDGLGFPVVQIESNPAGDVKQVSWLKDAISATDELVSEVYLGIYPNPAAHFLNVEIPEFLTGNLEIYDLNGRLSISRSIQGTKEAFDISSLPTGPYLLVLKNEKGRMLGFRRFQIMR